MLIALIVGLAVVNAVKLARFRKIVVDIEDPDALAWAREARAAMKAIVWTGIVAGGLNITGFFLLQPIGSIPFVGGRLEMYIAPAVPVLAVVILAALIGLLIVGIVGSRAERLRRRFGLEKPRLLNSWAKLGLFALGWFGFFLLSRFVAFHIARARGGFLM